MRFTRNRFWQMLPRLQAAMRCGALSAACASACAQTSVVTPDGVFVQLGAAADTYGASAGLYWNWGREFELGGARLTGYWEASVSQWSYPSSYPSSDVRRTAGLIQLGVIPVLRWRPASGSSPWFAEGGIGATLTTVAYQTDRKRFSTRFNFGDHLAFGRSFGPLSAHEISLRVEHFSNAGIRQPNPGENFVQIRYLYKLR